jgi:hypothetical protein
VPVVNASVDSALWPHWSTLDPKAKPPSPVRAKRLLLTGLCYGAERSYGAVTLPCLWQPRDRSFNWSSDPFIEEIRFLAALCCSANFG